MPDFLELTNFGRSVAKEIFEFRPEISSYSDERQAFYLGVAKRRISRWVLEGGALDRQAAKLLVTPILSEADREWKIIHGEAPAHRVIGDDDPEYQEAKAELADLERFMKGKQS